MHRRRVNLQCLGKSTPANNLIGRTPATGSASPQVAIIGHTLVVEGTPEDDHILIKATKRPDVVWVVFNGVNLGPRGTVTKIVVHASDGNDTVLVDPEIELPAQRTPRSEK